MCTNFEDYLQPEGKQVETEVDNIRINTQKSKGHIRRSDPKLLAKGIE